MGSEPNNIIILKAIFWCKPLDSIPIAVTKPKYLKVYGVVHVKIKIKSNQYFQWKAFEYPEKKSCAIK